MIKTFLSSLIRAILRHNLGTMASAISFFLVSSMIPLCMLLIYGAALFIPEASVKTFLEDLLQSYLPTIPSWRNLILSTVDRLILYRTAIGIIGLIGLLWTSVGGFVSVQQMMDTILEVRKRRSFLLQYVVGFSMLGILLALTIVSSSITAISPGIVAKLTNDNAASVMSLVHLIARLSFPLILFATCYFSYRVLPSSRISNLAIVIGAGFSTVGIYLCRLFFVIYTRHLGNYELIYGTLTILMLFAFWIYIVTMVFLIGFELSSTIHKLRSGGKGPGPSVPAYQETRKTPVRRLSRV